LLIFLTVIGCRYKGPLFFKVTLLPGSQDSLGPDYPLITEAYIITNPPEDTEALRILVDNHFKNVPLPNTQYYDIERRFYRETKETPRNYAETSFKYDSLDHHFEDKILIVDRIKDKNGEFLYYFFYKNGSNLEDKRISITLHRNPEK
jgi:hypothetical protein